MSRLSENLEAIIAILEVEVALIKKKLDKNANTPWWETIYGTFANDPMYDEAMKLGREYRESLRSNSSV